MDFYYCIFLMHCFISVSAVHVKVRVDHEDGRPVEFYEEDLTEDDFVEKPPFEMVDRNKRASYDDRPPPPQSRYRRDIYSQDLNMRRKPECDRDMNKMIKENKNKPIQLAYVVEPGEDIKLMCHYCGDSSAYTGIIEWKRLIRQTSADGQFVIKTVEEDFHDIEALNRFTKTTDWSLVIRNITEADADTYFCIDASKDVLVKDKMNFAGMKEMFTADITKEKFRLYYHLDIVKTSDIPAKIVTATDRLMEPTRDVTLNLEFYSDWKEWSSCSVCGKKGEQRRRGVCTVRILNNEQYVEPAYVYYALGTFKKGIPCRSTMFNVYGDRFTDRPDEIAIQQCNMSCKLNISAIKFSRLNSADIVFEGVQRKFPVDTVKVPEGGSTVIKCKGASLDDIVYWLNNSEYMTSFAVSHNTSGRVTIDVYGNLRITDAKSYDGGLLECWIRMKKTRAVQFIVTSSDPDAWKRHLKYVMYSYFINFCVFLALVFVKHWHRQVQTVTGYKHHALHKDDLDNNYTEEGGRPDTNVNAWDPGDSTAELNESDVSAQSYCEHVHGFHELPTSGGDGQAFYIRHY
ncbi:uncharacterized protein [Magallana gigas]|uniref:uncharacterized protein isoform X1 n=1 Tax=Magallana gigas TaxID=29159 RepID=UPI0033428132